MDFDFDARTDEDRTSPERAEHLADAAARISDGLPGEHRVHVASLDRATGNAAVIVSHRPEAGGEDFVRRALDHVRHLGPALGLAAEQPPEFQADPHVQRTSSGGAAVHLRQLYKGIPIYEASETVRFDPEGRLTEVAGRSHTVVADLPVEPSVSAAQALTTAARHVADLGEPDQVDPFGQPLGVDLDLTGFEPTPVTVLGDSPEQTISFAAPPFEGTCTVRLLWFPLDPSLRLAWQTVLQVPGGGQYRVVVDAADGTVLLVRQLTRSIAGSADVFLRHGGEARRRVPLPVPLAEWGITSEEDPADWLTAATTRGANADATAADSGEPAKGQTTPGGAVLFAPADPDSTEQLVVNLFALNGVMHDVLYTLGFREADGNFQVDNRGRGGIGSDRVRAIVHPGPVWGTANMGTPPDGFAPTMNMGLVASTDRHTALDADVVYHEYTHGLSNRLVGGPLDTTALDAPQSGGMGEGWGDYFACVLNGVETVGAWVVNNPRGIRRHRYDEHFPDDFGDLGQGRYTGVHAIGELWCATLMELNRRIGTDVAMQLVVDGMKLSASNPGFLAMRDAILVAASDRAAATGLDPAEEADLRAGVWDAFARFGMGPGASSVEATLGPVVADFTTPPREETGPTVSQTRTPNLAIPDDDPRGVASTVAVTSEGVVATLSVAVAIRHTYRGDLEVRLVAPDRQRVVLHDRRGGSADDLEETWTTDDAALAPLVGLAVAGDWTLEVIDRARWDTGTLDAWTLEIETAASRPVATASATPALAIPDQDPDGVESTVSLAGSAPIRHLRLDLDLTHSYVGDLTVALTGPTGVRVLVHDRSGGSSDNLIRSYSSDDSPLSSFVGLPAGGAWTLAVVDLERHDVGKLNRWSLHAEL